MTEPVALLLSRAGFGPTAGELQRARRDGYAATVAAMVGRTGPDRQGDALAPIPQLGPDPAGALPAKPTQEQFTASEDARHDQMVSLTRWWIDRMTVAEDQFTERLVLFWHGHWATSKYKVKSAQLMLHQQRIFRDSANFAQMAHRMVADPALIFWLDGHKNFKGAPNENLARELMELFTLGVGHYTERDVREAGRALTGWQIDFARSYSVFEKRYFDGGTKRILGKSARFDAGLLVEHLLAQPACPRFVAERLWTRYASSDPAPAGVVDRMAAAFPDHRAMLAALFNDDAFLATDGTRAKQPVEWFVGAMRQLGVRPADLSAQKFASVHSGLENLGQLPFTPPSVAGWPSRGVAWLTSSAAQNRMALAALLAELDPVPHLTVEGLAELLAVEVWTDRTYAVLKEIKDPRRLLIIGLSSPEYLVS